MQAISKQHNKMKRIMNHREFIEAEDDEAVEHALSCITGVVEENAFRR
jgi:hypothetical protein